MAYSAASNVADYCPGLLDDGVFTATTRPNKAAVERFLSSGCALIEGRLKSAGYDVPVPGTAAVYDQIVDLAVYDQIVDLETLYAAARAETVRMSARVAATERTRGQVFMDQFNQGIQELLKLDLSTMGVAYTGDLYAGGISRSDVTSQESDTDRVAPRFKRGQFAHPGTTRPSGSDRDRTDE